MIYSLLLAKKGVSHRERERESEKIELKFMFLVSFHIIDKRQNNSF